MTGCYRTINLQLFAGEKTEKATPKRRKEAREKGQVTKSVEVNSAINLLVAFGALKFLFPSIVDRLEQLFKFFLNNNMTLDDVFSYKGLQKLGLEIAVAACFVLGPILILCMISGLVINYGQVGFLFTTKTLTPKWSKLNPVEGFKRIFSKRALVELLKSIIKLAIVGCVIYLEFSKSIEEITGLAFAELLKGIVFTGDKAFSIGYKAALALLFLAAFDYLYQWWEHEKSLRMSKQEVKDEYKQTEGDPLIRSKIREKQREIGMRRMMQEVPKADVVITNPIHFAVALRYKQEEDEAPVVVAKGQDYLALKIKEIAKGNDVVVVENKPLAQALFRSTEVGQSIPPELFHAVAEVLAFVYNLKNKSI